MAPEMHSAPLGEAAREATPDASADVSADVSAVASLDEPTRRRIYDYVGAQAAPVSRDDVAVALGVPKRTAAFHLDRLAELDLLAVSFARRSGRRPPSLALPALGSRSCGLAPAPSLRPDRAAPGRGHGPGPGDR